MTTKETAKIIYLSKKLRKINGEMNIKKSSECIKENFSDELNALKKRYRFHRDNLIRMEISKGVPSRIIAEQFKISSARVSQIAPRRNFET